MINNDPFLTRRITYNHIIWNNSFNISEIDNIVNICEKEELLNPTTVGAGEKCEDYRRSKIKFYGRNVENSWIFERLNGVIESINNTYYGFDLYGYSSFQYTVYNSENKGEYNWHTDIIFGNNLGGMESQGTRKLSVVMLLTQPQVDFSGGEFQLNGGSENNPITPVLNKGDIIAFPSFMIHKVKPVLLGVRRSIVIWVEGPKFR